MLVYWMETVGDWGQQLVYSPVFRQHHLLDWLPLKTPNDPMFMPFAYAVYWTVHALVVLALGQMLVERLGWSLLKSMAVLALPVNYVWDIFVEGIAARMGWWTYDPGFGPVLRFAEGGQVTLLWTVGLMTFWPNLIAYWAGKPPVRTLNHFERFFRLDRFTRPKPAAATPDSTGPGQSDRGLVALAAQRSTRIGKREQHDALLEYEITIPRWKFEAARFGAWFVVFQVSFFVLLIVPLVAMHMLTGHDSIYVP